MADLSAPPVLSTPDDHILESLQISGDAASSGLSDAVIASVYEIDRTATDVLAGKWKRVALQFPDFMLVDAPRVAQTLTAELKSRSAKKEKESDREWDGRIYILGDTSYGACCVDEVAAEHADADVVVHYGRACLSPTSRLPVLYVYTSRELDRDAALKEFRSQFVDKESKVVMVADLMYQNHVGELVRMLGEKGYTNVLATDVVRDPAGVIPNRTVRLSLDTPDCLDDEAALKSYSLFHLSDPPPSLLLALYNRFSSLHVLSTQSSSYPENKPSTLTLENPTLRTAALLRRRFARVLSLASAGVIGILVNTLSVTASLSSIDHLRRRIAAADKKSYTVVVGRLNPAKLANFSEVEGWVVVGCWEGGLVQGEEDYWRPVITPFELEVALMSEDERIWGAEWWGGTEKLKLVPAIEEEKHPETNGVKNELAPEVEVDGGVDGDESLPPVFDLRTGKLVSNSRPMQLPIREMNLEAGEEQATSSGGPTSLIQRSRPGELASINGVVSPGAEYLRSQRTWQGLGSDFAEAQDEERSTLVEEGRSGIARGYTVGDAESKH